MALLVQMLRNRLWMNLAAVLLTGLGAVMALWWNARLGLIINVVSAGEALAADVIVSALVIMLAWAAVSFAGSYATGLACAYMTHDLRMGYARHFSALSLCEVEQLGAGGQVSGLQNEIADASRFFDGNLFQLVGDGIRFIVTLGWLLIVNAGLTLAVNLPAVLILIYVFFASGVISRATERSQQAKGQMNAHADMLLTLFPIIRLYNAARMVLGQYDRAVGEWERQTVHAERTRARLLSLSGLLSNIPLVLLFFVGGGMAIRGALSIGTLYVFLNLSGNVSGVMMNMPGYFSAFRQFLVNMDRLSETVLPEGRGAKACASR